MNRPIELELFAAVDDADRAVPTDVATQPEARALLEQIVAEDPAPALLDEQADLPVLAGAGPSDPAIRSVSRAPRRVLPAVFAGAAAAALAVATVLAVRAGEPSAPPVRPTQPAAPPANEPAPPTDEPALAPSGPCARSRDPACGPLTWTVPPPANAPMQVEVRAVPVGGAPGVFTAYRFEYRATEADGVPRVSIVGWGDGNWTNGVVQPCATARPEATGSWSPADAIAERNAQPPGDAPEWRPLELAGVTSAEATKAYAPGVHVATIAFTSAACDGFDPYFASEQTVTVTVDAR